ncbi:hypothetical protein L3Y34_019191 [Caenorhabditis briggsae]|uniref:Homeobox domain-containing protein n=1 Tax=Caenorhabditis briggsae TaxID=6238 RepID=A0AAE9DNI9_CAEBR|nr:hypothetical protein L3Y34_019191 [Caenorhabditis briggsae]
MVYTKKQVLSSQDHASTSRGRGRPRKAVQEATNPKRRRIIDSSESDSEEDIPVARRTKDPLSSSSSSSEMESDSEFSDVEDETEDERSEVPIQETGSKQKRKRKNIFTEEQYRLLLATLQENHYPTKEQREELAEKADLTRQQIRSWFERNRRKNPTLLKYRQLTEEQTSKLDDVFAVNPRPDKATIASLASELQLEKDRVRNYFMNRRSKTNAKLPRPLKLPLEEAEPILLEVFRKNPQFRDYKNFELREKTGWSVAKISKFFVKCRKENGIADHVPLPEEEAVPILMEMFKKNPLFKDYKNIELKNELHWGYHRISKFFNERRKQNRISNGPKVSTRAQSKHNRISIGDSPLPEEEAQPILMDIFRKNPLFHDYKNVELKNQIQWTYRRIESWFVRQRKSNQQEKLDHFNDVMEKAFQKQQYFGTRSEALEVETGASWNKILAWLKNKRKNTLEAYLTKETSFLPNDMANFERIYKKYDRPICFDAVRCIEQKENVSGYNLSDYLMDRQSVQAKLRKEKEGVQMEPEEEEYEDEQDAHEEDHIEQDLDYQMDSEHSFQLDAHQEDEDHGEKRGAEEDTDEELEEEPVDQSEPNNQMGQEPIVNREAGELEFENDDIEFDNQEAAVVEEHHGRVEGPEVDQQVPEQQVTEQEAQLAAHQEPVVDVEQEEGSVDRQDAHEEYQIEPELNYHIDEEHDVEPAVSQEAVAVEFENEEIGFNNPQEALFNQELLEQIDETVADLIAPVNVKVEYPDPDIKNVERLENPVKEEVVDENEENELVVFDVIDLGASQDVDAVGPVSIVRIQATMEDIQPDIRDIIGFPEIGFARKTEMSENKSRLDLENLTLPFNCSTDNLRWSKLQIMEFFCQLFKPATTKRLIKEWFGRQCRMKKTESIHNCHGNILPNQPIS